MTYTLYDELQEFGDSDETIGNIPEDLKHRIEIVLEDGSMRKVTYYEIQLDGERIGMIEDVHDWRHPVAEALLQLHDPESLKQYYYKRYYLTQPKRTEAEARAESDPSVKNIYYFDEKWWDDEDCSDAWYPTFSTLEKLINHYLKQQKESK